MIDPCQSLPGWGSIPYGSAPWSGTIYPGDQLPAYPPFDIVCLGPCGSLLAAEIYAEVDLSPGGQWLYDAGIDSIHLWSGYTAPAEDRAYFDINIAIPDVFTAEWTVRFEYLPTDFSVPADRHVHLGAGSHQGYIGGLMFSSAGVAFVPCPGTDSGVTAIPGSSGIITLDETYIIRMVVSAGATYIYITRYVDYLSTGHTLRFILESVKVEDVCPAFTLDKAWVSVKGEYSVPPTGARVSVWVSEFCLSSSELVSDYPPIADAGPDQASQFCTIVQLDGSGSTDPEGNGLTYRWRLLDAPQGSGFLLDGLLGQSHPLPTPTGYTDKWYSTQLSALPVGSIVPGDILLVRGQPYTILALGTDGYYGDYIQVSTQSIPDGLSEQSFKVLSQFGVSGADTQKPVFYPDVPGFYKFDLSVFDGAIWSLPAVTVVNVITTVTPRGIVPDLRFIWEYLSNFWKLVDGKERYTVVWSGLAQFVAAELLNLWQYEYSKSLRDIQRTFQRRWLSYSLRYNPPRGTSTLRKIFSSYTSSTFDPAGVAGIPGTSVAFQLPIGDPVYVDFHTALGMTDLTADEIANQLRTALPSAFTVTVVTLTSATAFVRVSAIYPFSVVGSTCSLFSVASKTTTLGGDDGSVLWEGAAYSLGPSVNLAGAGIVENDFLAVDGELYRITKLQKSDTGLYNVVVLKDSIPTTASSTWSIPSYFTVTNADFYNALLTSDDCVILDVRDTFGNSIAYKTTAYGSCSGDATALGVELSAVEASLYYYDSLSVSILTTYRRRYVPINSAIVDIPFLQETLTEAPENAILRRNLDFFLEEYRQNSCIRFEDVWYHEDDEGNLEADATPPNVLWAEVSYLDNGPAIEGNFGIPVEFTRENLEALQADVDYLSAVKGLWYSNLNGPILKVLRVGTQILLGLPFAEEDGTIEEIRDDYSPNTGRILVRDTVATTIVRSYVYPSNLGLEVNPSTGVEYAVGDSVTQFAPLVKGIELLDYVSDSSWMDLYAEQGAASILQRFFRFLIRVDYGAFKLAALLFAREFILKVKPHYVYPIFSVLYDMEGTSVDATDEISMRMTFSIYDTPNGGTNTAKMFDQPEDSHDSIVKIPAEGPIGSPWKNSFDVGYSSRSGVVDWAFDDVCPAEDLSFTMCTELLVDSYPPVDSVFALDLPVYEAGDPGTPVYWRFDEQLPAGTYCRDVET